MDPAKVCANGSEAAEQSALFCWANHADRREEFPALFGPSGRLKLFAINNNAGKGDMIRGAMAKAQGVKAGVGDTFLPLARHGMHGLFVEMKVTGERHPSGRDGVLSKDQKQFWQDIHADGYGYAVAKGWEEARDIIIAYLS